MPKADKALPRVTRPPVPRVQPRFDTENTPLPPTLGRYLPADFSAQLNPRGQREIAGMPVVPIQGRSRAPAGHVNLNISDPWTTSMEATHEAMHTGDAGRDIGAPPGFSSYNASRQFYLSANNPTPWQLQPDLIGPAIEASLTFLSPRVRSDEVLATATQIMTAANQPLSALRGMGYTPAQLSQLTRYFWPSSLGLGGGRRSEREVRTRVWSMYQGGP